MRRWAAPRTRSPPSRNGPERDQGRDLIGDRRRIDIQPPETAAAYSRAPGNRLDLRAGLGEELEEAPIPLQRVGGYAPDLDRPAAHRSAGGGVASGRDVGGHVHHAAPKSRRLSPIAAAPSPPRCRPDGAPRRGSGPRRAARSAPPPRSTRDPALSGRPSATPRGIGSTRPRRARSSRPRGHLRSLRPGTNPGSPSSRIDAPNRRSAEISGPTGRSRRRGTPSIRQVPGRTAVVATRKRVIVPPLPQKSSRRSTPRACGGRRRASIAGRSEEQIAVLLADRQSQDRRCGQEQLDVLGSQSAAQPQRLPRQDRQVDPAVGLALRTRRRDAALDLAAGQRESIRSPNSPQSTSKAIPSKANSDARRQRHLGRGVEHVVSEVGQERAPRRAAAPPRRAPRRSRSGSGEGGSAAPRGSRRRDRAAAPDSRAGSG